ncbi:MAG: alpha/beta fold hydrolase, partial [Rhodocyclaceae bacterium]
LVHGWGGRGSQLWAFVQPLLDAGYAVVTFDAPAHGFSGSRYASLLHFARAIQAVVDCVGGVHGVIAHSLGGAASNLALARGWISLQRIVTIAAPTDFDSYSRQFARQMNVSDAVRDAMQKHLEHRLGFTWQELEGGLLAARNTIPALVIHDRNDKEVPFSSGQRIAAQWPGALLLPTEQLGHRRILRDAGVVARSVEFIGTHRRASDHPPLGESQ